MAARTEAVVFDLGGVLIDWDPRYLYDTLIPDEERRAFFLGEVCDMEWNAKMDRGLPFAQAIKTRQEKHPDFASEIAAYFERWEEMLGGPIQGTVELLEALDDARVPIYALTNWSAETFGHALARYPFLGRFRDIFVSGEERVAKPEMNAYVLLLERNALEPAKTLFIDDREKNVQAARLAGMQAVTFKGPEELRRELVDRELIRE
ncbi:MAG: HAD family phosphatase [Myxococcota bacterium]